MIIIDTSVLIEYFRKKDKTRTFFYELSGKYAEIGISVITKYEIFVGSKDLQDDFWHSLFTELKVFHFTDKEMFEAVSIQKSLLKANMMIGFGDIAIGATAKAHNQAIATMNVKHFERIN
ncbi:MAG: type II toxin-antitoxin system VapC family toxin [Bacteroidia bacterium]|nr:type II toxin-antitoxin system VapC family toxin [Bacteroidia bacterium]